MWAYSATARQGALAIECRAATLSIEDATAWERARPQLRRLKAGRLPPHMESWPDNASQEAGRPVRKLVWELGVGWRVLLPS